MITGKRIPERGAGRAAGTALLGLATGLVPCIVSCSQARGEPRAPRIIGEPRELASAAPELRLHATSAERFGLGAPSVPGGAAPDAEPEGLSLVWDTPPGWVELAPSAMRAASFRVASDERAECTLTFLAGEAGGLKANVDRWRAQMSLSAADPTQLDALERVEFLGGQGVLLDLEGAWKGMEGGTGQPGHRLIGLLLVDPAGSAFLKMVGPDEVLSREREAFLQLARSFRAGAADDPAEPEGPIGGPTGESTGGRGIAGDLSFTVPAGWRRAPDRATRAVSFSVGPVSSGNVECYVTVLSGDGGGALANVNRWRAQLGREPLSAEELARLEELPMLGSQGLFVEVQGTEDALLLGALSVLADRAVFVKLSGPRERVAPERTAFRAFAGSLELAR